MHGGAHGTHTTTAPLLIQLQPVTGNLYPPTGHPVTALTPQTLYAWYSEQEQDYFHCPKGRI